MGGVRMEAEVLCLHPPWCQGDTRDETRMRKTLDADPESLTRLHYVDCLRLSFPLLAAVVAGHTYCARVLAQAEVTLERRRTVTGVPAIARALVHGKKSDATKTVKILLQCGASPNYTGSRGPRTSLLHLAVKSELPLAMLALLEAGARTEDWSHVRSEPGPSCTPLLHACSLLDPELLRILLRHGASTNPHYRVASVSVPTPAHVVVRSCLKRKGDKQDVSVTLLNLLHQHGSDIWRRDDVTTPLECARMLPELHSVLERLISCPATLLCLCRASVRLTVKPQCIGSLPVPDSIKLYLLE